MKSTKIHRGQTIIEAAIVTTILIIVSLLIIPNFFEYKTYNKIHHTNYSMSDFIFAREIILDYQGNGKIQTYKLNVSGDKNEK